MLPNAPATEQEEERRPRGERHLADCGQTPLKVAGTTTWPRNQPITGRQRRGDSPITVWRTGQATITRSKIEV